MDARHQTRSSHDTLIQTILIKPTPGADLTNSTYFQITGGPLVLPFDNVFLRPQCRRTRSGIRRELPQRFRGKVFSCVMRNQNFQDPLLRVFFFFSLLSSAVFGIEKSFSIFSAHIELVGFAFDIEKWYWEYWEYWIPNTALLLSSIIILWPKNYGSR